MARALTVVVLCLCIALSFAADLRKLIEERANQLTPPARGAAGGVAGKNAGDLDTANSWGWGGPGFYGGWGGPWGYGPWGYGYGFGYGYPFGGWW